MTQPPGEPHTPVLPRFRASRRRTWPACLVVAVALVAWPARPALAQTVRGTFDTTMQQCANRINGATSSINNCTGSAWVKGNLNVNNSVYRQGDFVPFRLGTTGFVAGRTYSVRIGYDAVESGLHAYDYLGSYDASAAPGQQLVPCDGVAGTAGPHACGNSPSTLAVPLDTNTTFPSGAGQVAGNFSAWGGTLQSAAYVNPSPIDASTTGTVERAVDVTFTAAGGTVVLAWGGHIASALDWGPDRVYTSVRSGAPFHMRLKQVQESGQPPETVGNQELSMHASALAPAPGLITQVAPSSATTDETVVDTATLTGVSGSGEVRGTVEFFVCFGATAQPDCSQGGTSIGLQNVVLGVGSNNGSASMGFSADQEVGGQGPGFYCFRVEYTPAPNALYTPAVHTNTTTECFQATLPPPLLTVTKLCNPESDPGLFNLLVNGSPVPNGSDVPCGGSRGPFETTVGSHTVSESAGTGTDLGNYTSAFGGDCAPAGSLVLALGDSAICTITNTRLPPPPPATLTVHKICDPADDPGQFAISIDGLNVSALNVATVGCGDSVGPIQLAPGSYTVSEAGVPPTSLSDYTTVISGDCATDGTITLASGGSGVCTFTNTRNPPPATTLRIDKVCDLSNDPGLFNLNLDGIPLGGVAGTDVPCGGTTGAIQVAPGSHTVTETAGTGTSLGNYTSTISGDCAADGSITLALGDTATCTITNTRLPPPPPTTLTVNKVCDPTDDPGQFAISIDGPNVSALNIATLGCGDSVGPVQLAPGSYTVSEAGIPPTDLADYTTVISGDCAADGSITLASGDSGVCTITNTRNPPPVTTLRIDKICDPSNDPGLFNLNADGVPLGGTAGTDVPCGGTTGAVSVAPGSHTVSETAGTGTHLGNYTTTISGDCAGDGSITLTLGDTATCIVTNVHNAAPPPATLTVHKICDPANDPGNFVILVDLQPVAVLGCGESTTPVTLAAGTYTVREAGGDDTSLSDYTTAISGACAPDGSITLASGDSADCTFTNTRVPPTVTTLSVRKACLPAGDDGRFKVGIFTVDGTLVHRAVLHCGGSTGAVQLQPGTYVVRERGAGSTELSDYHRFVGGDCAFDGSVVVEAGDHLRCLIVNVRKGTQPLPAELTVTKICDPVDDGGRFDLTVDEQTEQDVACGGSFGPVTLAP